jgi:hypothetical protein
MLPLDVKLLDEGHVAEKRPGDSGPCCPRRLSFLKKAMLPFCFNFWGKAMLSLEVLLLDEGHVAFGSEAPA